MLRHLLIAACLSVAYSQRNAGYHQRDPYSSYPVQDRYTPEPYRHQPQYQYKPQEQYKNDYKPSEYHQPQQQYRPQYEQTYSKTAITYIQGVGNFSHVRGTLTFTQTSPDSSVIVLGEIIGLSPGLHGMHIHEKGDTGDECKAAGPHFNPFKKQHGAPTDVERHVGDLGNIETPAYGPEPSKTSVYIVDDVISLSGERSILGRAIVLHAGRDDLGRGNNEESKKTGNSGARVGCGVIVEDDQYQQHQQYDGRH